MAFEDLPRLVIRVGTPDDLPSDPPDHKSGLWAIDRSGEPSQVLYISNEDGSWDRFFPFASDGGFGVEFSSGFGGGEVAEKGILGEISLYAGTAVPVGYAPCDGSTVLRSDYQNLITLALSQDNVGVGKLFGEGDGETTFVLPNLDPVAPAGTIYIVKA